MYFIDTNVFVYTVDKTDERKTKIARKLIAELVESGEGRISTQVIQEFCNVALCKAKKPLSVDDVRLIISELLSPLLAHQPDADFYQRVIKTHAKYSLSFYDSAIVQAAIDMKCDSLYSEDMQAGALYGGVRVVNPFDGYSKYIS